MNPIAPFTGLAPSLFQKALNLGTAGAPDGDTGEGGTTSAPGTGGDVVSLSRHALRHLANPSGEAAGIDRQHPQGSFAGKAGKFARKALQALREDLGGALKSMGFDTQTVTAALKSFIKPALQALRHGADFTGSLTAFSATSATVVAGDQYAQAQSLLAKSVEIEINQSTGNVSIDVASIEVQSASAGDVGEGFVPAGQLGGLLAPLVDGTDDDGIDDILDLIAPPDVAETIDEADESDESAAPVAADAPTTVLADRGDATPQAIAEAGQSEEDSSETVTVDATAPVTEPAGVDGADPAETDGVADAIAATAEAAETAESEPFFEAHFRLDAVLQFSNDVGDLITRITLDAHYTLTQAGSAEPASEPVITDATDEPQSLIA